VFRTGRANLKCRQQTLFQVFIQTVGLAALSVHT